MLQASLYLGTSSNGRRYKFPPSPGPPTDEFCDLLTLFSVNSWDEQCIRKRRQWRTWWAIWKAQCILEHWQMDIPSPRELTIENIPISRVCDKIKGWFLAHCNRNFIFYPQNTTNQDASTCKHPEQEQEQEQCPPILSYYYVVISIDLNCTLLLL